MSNAIALSEIRVGLSQLTKLVNSLNSRPLPPTDRRELLAIQNSSFKDFAVVVQILMRRFQQQ